MISENETPANELNNNNNTPENKPGHTGESAMSILEKRLAEINARKNGGTAPETQTPVKPLETKPEAAAIPQPTQPAPEVRPEPVAPQSNPETPANNISASTETNDTISGAIAAREVMPPVITEGSVLNENVVDTDAMDDNNRSDQPASSGNMEATNKAFSAQNSTEFAEKPNAAEINTETVYRPNVSDLPEIDVTAVETETSDNSFSAETNQAFENNRQPEVTDNVFVTDEPVAETEIREENPLTTSSDNSVGNLISGAIAMHEVIPEVTPAQRQQNADAGNIAGNDTDSFQETADDEVLTEADYSGMSADELGNRIMTMAKTTEVRKHGRQVMALYREYEVKVNAEKAEALQRFVDEGGNADDFEFRLPQERLAVEKAMQAFRETRQREYKNEEEQKTKNLQRKQQLITELRALIEAAETKASADRIKAIQEEWKAAGPVPQAESQKLWNSYHALLDIFYNNRSIFNELKDLDRKRNLNAKEALCERAEALTANPSINESLNELKHLHEEWKNIGPVPNDQRDPVWERFLAASEKVHDRKKEFLEGRRAKEQENLTQKNALLERVTTFENYNTDRINDWRDKTDEIQKLKAEWDAIGLVPKEQADQVNKRFWGVYKQFFNQKNAYFKALDDQKMANLKLKTELCERAEAVKDSKDWDATKEELIRLQKQWKTIGRVPDKYSDKIWERFRAACNEFFDRKQADIDNKEQELEKLSTEKNNYLSELTQLLDNPENKVTGSVEELHAMEAKWRSFDGENQRLNPKAEEKFYSLMEKYLDTVPEITYDQKNAILFKLQMDKLKNGPDAADKIRQKEQSIRKEIGELENDIRTLNTNIEFFARSKNAAQLREEYQQRTNEAQKRIDALKIHLKALRG